MKQILSEWERKDIIFTVEEERKKKYWKYINNHLKEMLERENKILDEYKFGAINEVDMKDWNIIIEKIAMIKRFMNINEEIIYKHTKFLENFKNKISSISGTVGTFVGMFSSKIKDRFRDVNSR